MSLTVILNWKAFAVLGATAVCTIFSVKMDSDAVERVSIHAIDAFRDYAIASIDNR